MKEAELRKHAVCDLCHNKIGHTQIPLFWRVTVERFGLKLPAMMRQDGLAQMLGGASYLASVMGPDEDLAVPMMEPVVLTLCEICAQMQDIPCAALQRAAKVRT